VNPPSPATLRVGNDVVDLEWVRDRLATPGREERFLRRILSDEERATFSALDHQEREARTWVAWAAKEAAFKIHTKLLGAPPVFRPAGYTARLDGPSASSDPLVPLEVVVEWSGPHPDGSGRETPFSARLTGWSGDRFLHLAGVGAPAPLPTILEAQLETGVEWIEDPDLPPSPGALDRFTETERAAMRSPLSTRVRILARSRIESHLQRLSGNGEVVEVEIRTDPRVPGRSPPRIWIQGEPAPHLDLSLSHHGRCVAWALLIPRAGPHAPRGPHLVV
jgi:hypothetical protein